MDASVIMILFIFAIVLAICWIVLPFAVIGTKPLLRELIREQKRTNDLLEGGRTMARAREPERIIPEGAMGRRERFAGSPNLPPT